MQQCIVCRCGSQHEALFRDGEYVALRVEGHHAEHICAFARRHETRLIIVVVQRLVSALGASPGNLPIGGRWSTTWIQTPMLASRSSGENVLSGRHLTVGNRINLSAQEVFAVAPFSVLYFPLAQTTGSADTSSMHRAKTLRMYEDAQTKPRWRRRLRPVRLKSCACQYTRCRIEPWNVEAI